MAGLGILFAQDFPLPPQQQTQTSRTGRAKSLSAFGLPDDTSLLATASRYPDHCQRTNTSAAPPQSSTNDDQAQCAGYDLKAYIPSGQTRQTLTNANHLPAHDTIKQSGQAAFLKSNTSSTARHIRFESAPVNVPGPASSGLPYWPDCIQDPVDRHSAPDHSLVEPGELFMTRWENTKQGGGQEQDSDRNRPLHQASGMNDYLGAGIMAAMKLHSHGLPSLDLLRAIALNSPSNNSFDSSAPPLLTPPFSNLHGPAPNGSSRLPAFLQNRKHTSPRDGLSPITPTFSAHAETPNSPSRLPPFLQKRKNVPSQDTLKHVSAPLNSFAAGPGSPVELPSSELPPRSTSPSVTNLREPPIASNVMERATSAVQPPRNSIRHRTMRSMNDIQFLYDVGQCHPHYFQPQKRPSEHDFFLTRGQQLRAQPAPENIHLTPRSWTVENLFDCPELACSPNVTRLRNRPDGTKDSTAPPQGATNPRQATSRPIIEVKKPLVPPTSGVRSADVKVSNGPSRSRHISEPRDMQRSQSEGSSLKSNHPLNRRSTSTTAECDYEKRCRELTRLLEPFGEKMGDDDDADEGPRPIHGSRPSTSCSNHSRELGKSSRKVAREADSNMVPLVGLKRAKKARVELDLFLESSLIVEGGKLVGRFEVKVPHQHVDSHKNNSGDVWLGEPKIRIIGFEEIPASDARNVFYHLPVNIPMHNNFKTEESKATNNLLRVSEHRVDEEGFRLGRGGIHLFPFQINLPLGQGAKGSWKGKQGTVRYIVIGSIKLKSIWGGDRSIAHFHRHIEFYPYFDPLKILSLSPQPLRVTTSKALFMGGQGKVHLAATLHRSIWVSGQRCHVDVLVRNDGSKKVKALTLALIRTTTVYRSKAQSPDSDTDCQTVGDGSKHPDLYSTQTTKKKMAESVLNMGKKSHQGLVTAKGLWMGVDQGEGVGFSHFLTIPSEALTITRGRCLEVSYAIKVSVGGSFSSDVSVDVPITVINFVSIDPPPGHATRSIEENDGIQKLHPLVSTNASSVLGFCSGTSQKEPIFILKGIQNNSCRNLSALPTPSASDLKELDLFMASSKFPEEGLPQTFDQKVEHFKVHHQRHQSEGNFLDLTLRGHKTPFRKISDSIENYENCPLSSFSRLAFDEPRSEATKGLSNPTYLNRPATGHKRVFSSRIRSLLEANI